MEETYIFSLSPMFYMLTVDGFFFFSYTGWKVTEAPWGINLQYDLVHVSFYLKCDKDFIFLFQKGEKKNA